MATNENNTVPIEGFYDWGPGVVVTADCLGSSYRTTLGGRALQITMPTFDGTSVVEPPLLFKRPNNWVNVDPPNPWGELRAWNDAGDGTLIPATVCIKRARIVIWISHDEFNDGVGPKLDELLSSWWEALSSWIEVATGQDLATHGERRPKMPQHFHLWAGNPDGTMRPLSMMLYGKFFPTGINVLTPSGVAACLTAVARGDSPPPERLHLSDARSLHNDEQWRRAVIDAATAAEVAITSWLDNRLNNAEPEVKSALLGAPLTLGRLHRLYTRLGGTLPPDFDKLVVTPRNHAAHRGLALTEKESETAIEATAKLLDSTSPMPF